MYLAVTQSVREKQDSVCESGTLARALVLPMLILVILRTPTFNRPLEGPLLAERCRKRGCCLPGLRCCPCSSWPSGPPSALAPAEEGGREEGPGVEGGGREQREEGGGGWMQGRSEKLEEKMGCLILLD
jgi:hypothetical protein